MENLKNEILNKGRLIPDSEAPASNSVLCIKMEVGPKNRKPMAGPLLAAPNDVAGYETPVENLNKEILNKGRLIPDSDASALSNALCDKLEVGPKNRKPMARPLQAAPCDGCYEMPVENLNKEILNKGPLIPELEASASNSTLCDKREVGLKNRKPMAGPLQAASSDDGVHDTPVENLQEDSTGIGTVIQRSSYIYGNDLEA